MDDEIRIRPLPPYPRKSRDEGPVPQGDPGDEDEDEGAGGRPGAPGAGEPEVKDGHIDTRVDAHGKREIP